MATVKTAAVVSMLFALAVSLAPVRADDDDDPKTKPMTPKQFADRVGRIIVMVAGNYYYEVDSGELLRWAVHGVYDRRYRTIPEELAERLDKARNPKKKELSDLLTDIATDVGGDLRWSADIACERMLGRLDGRTQIIDPDRAFFLGSRRRTADIGVKLAVDQATGMIRVAYPLRHGPAYRAGLRSGDVITEILRPKPEVMDEPPPGVEKFPTKGMTIADAKMCLWGEPDRSLYLHVRRPGIDKVLEFTVLRVDSKAESVFGVRRDQDDLWEHWLDLPHQIGYLRLSHFVASTPLDVANGIAALRMQGMKGLVLDLRGNHGGLFDAGLHVGSQFVGNAKFGTIHNRVSEPYDMIAEDARGFKEFPIACLVNDDTSGIAEALAACLQDQRRAEIIGERTQGNAAAVGIYNVGDDRRMRLTTGVILRPNGKKLDRIHSPGKPSDEWGVTPDKGFELALTEKEREQLRAHFASQLVIPPAGHAKPAAVSNDRQLEIAVGYLLKHPSNLKRRIAVR